jgi:thymidine kinase
MVGKIILITGPMKSYKSTEMWRRLERQMIAGKKVAIVRPKIDTRRYVTRNHKDIPAPILGAERLAELKLDDFDAIGVDEGQFFKNLAGDANRLANSGKLVIISALNGTAEQKPWREVQRLFPLVDDIVFLHAVCDRCGKNGAFSYFKGGKDQQVVIGDREYISLCRECLRKAGQES